jgi:hypothetical protein
MSIVITPLVQPGAAQSATAAPVVLQPGSVISARVQQILTGDTVRITIGSQSIDVQSQVPLQAGQVLQLAVSQTSDGTVRLAVVSPQDGAPASQASSNASSNASGAGATPDSVTLAPAAAASITPQSAPAAVAPTIQLTAQEVLAVSVAAQTAATQQTSLAPLFANLTVAAGLQGLPPQVLQAVAQLLAQQTSLDQGLTGNDIKQAFQSSGLFLEASLAAGSLTSSAATTDLKAALIVLRQVLATSLNGVTAPQNAPLPAAAAALQGGATPTAPLVQLATNLAAATVPQGVASIVVPQGTPAAVLVIEQGALAPAMVLSQPVITVLQETPLTASPALAPLLATETAALAASLQGATVPNAAEILNVGISNQVVLPPSTMADAASRAAASSAALNLLQGAIQAGPLTVLNPSGLLLENNQMLSLVPAVGGARPAMVDESEFARTNVPPPPISGALPAAQPILPATLVSNSPAESAMHRLLADTDAAIARQTLLQVASLPGQVDTTTGRLDPAAARWSFEIPFAMPQGTAMAQFEISRDGGGGNEIQAAKQIWRARFSLDVEPAGPVHALVTLSGDKTSVRMWAERPATAAQLRAGAAQLSQALSKAELQPGDIVIRDGTPPQPAPARAGHFLDRAL